MCVWGARGEVWVAVPMSVFGLGKAEAVEMA